MAQSLIQKLKILVDVTGTSEDDLLNIYLDLSKQAVMKKLYPYGKGHESLPKRYEDNVLQIASYLYNKQGAEGETVHKENGIDRTYASANIPNAFLDNIVPMVGGF